MGEQGMKEVFSKGNAIRWLGIFALYTILLWVTIAASVSWILMINLRINQMLNMLIFSAAIGFIICIFGFFKVKIIFWLSTAGIVIGAVVMMVLFATKGVEDNVIPLIILLMSFLGGLILGLVVHFVAYWVRKLQNRR